jgi:hypothetical protein
MIIRLVTVASVAAVVLGLPTGAAAQAPAGDSVTGSGTARFFTGGLAGLTQPFDVDIRAGRNGESPSGTLTLLFTFTDPTCLVVGGPAEEPPTATVNLLNPFTGGRTVFQLGSVGGSPQLIALAAADSPDDCSLGSSFDAAEVISGQIDIVDAPALPTLPTSRNDCKHGGWAQLGFKNQGQCIRFVRLIPGPGPYPSTRAECQHGGWAQFGFKNKRKCLRFVRLRPDP